MSEELLKQIAKAVLYEGYMLYPYRPSSIKNRQRFNFGVLVPEQYEAAHGSGESSTMKTECLIRGDSRTMLEVRIRFLQLQLRYAGLLPVSDPDSWQEAVEREVRIPAVRLSAEPNTVSTAFGFPDLGEVPADATTSDNSSHETRVMSSIYGAIDLSIERLQTELFKVRVQISNLTPFSNTGDRDRNEALMSALVSAHTILSVSCGEFISLLDPPEVFQEAARGCDNRGTWPVLVGEAPRRDLMLSSPIILYDYPAIAPESAGDLFDGTEIDEILTLRIMTLTDAEKLEMSRTDARSREILQRVESLSESDMRRLHGVIRNPNPARRTANE